MRSAQIVALSMMIAFIAVSAGLTSSADPLSSARAVEAASSQQISPVHAPVPATFGETWFDATVSQSYAGGAVTLAANSDGTGAVVVDDEIVVNVTRPNSTVASFSFDYSHGCQGFIQPEPPQDITSLFQPGTNQVHVQFRDLCGASKSSSSIWLVIGSAPSPQLRVTSITSPSSGSEKACYEVRATVVNDASTAGTGTVILSETPTYLAFPQVLSPRPVNWSIGDARKVRLGGCSGSATSGPSQQVSVPGNGSTVAVFGISHDWNWIPPGSGFNFVKESLIQACTSVLTLCDLAQLPSDINQLIDLVSRIANARPRASYTYSLGGGSVGGSPASASTTLSVTKWKVKALTDSMTAYAISISGCRLWDAIIGLGKILPFAQKLFASVSCGLSFSGTASGFYKLAFDPNPDYTVVDDPQPLNLPFVDALAPGIQKDAALSYEDLVSLTEVASLAGAKAEAAHDDGAFDWEVLQRGRAKGFLAQTGADFVSIDRAAESFAVNGTSLTPADDALYLQQVASTGLSPELASVLTELGLTADDLQDIATAIVDIGPGFALNANYLEGSSDLGNRSAQSTATDLLEEELATTNDALGIGPGAVDQATLDGLAAMQTSIQTAVAKGWQTDLATGMALGLLGSIDAAAESSHNSVLVPYRLDAGELFASLVSEPSDNVAPTTSADIGTPSGRRGWYASDVTVTLTAMDAADFLAIGSGVASTQYRINGGVWSSYASPFVVSTESLDNVVEFYSTDVAGNVEATHGVHFKLDKTRPDISISSGALDGLTWDHAHLQHGVLTNTGALALAGNATDNLCLWEVRTVDVDSGLTTASQQPANANLFPPPPPTSLDYSLNVPLHTGINTIDVTAEDCAGWTKAVRIQIVYVVPGPFDPRGKGLWYNAIKTGKYTTPQLQTLIDYTNVASDVWGTDTSRDRYGALTVARARDLLNYSDTNPDMELKMEGHLLAEWLNMVSGRLAVKKAVNVSPISGWPTVMDDIGGNPLTFAYKVALEVEEKVQPAKASFGINSVSKALAEGVNERVLIVP